MVSEDSQAQKYRSYTFLRGVDIYVFTFTPVVILSDFELTI